MGTKHSYLISGCAYNFAPILTHIAILSCGENDVLSIPESVPFQGEWGRNDAIAILEESEHELPKDLHLIYLSLLEQQFYIINEEIPPIINEYWNTKDSSTGNLIYNKVVIGMAPYGNVAFWLAGYNKEMLLFFTKGRKINLSLSDFLPNICFSDINELCSYFVMNNGIACEYQIKNGTSSSSVFEKYMQQFTYRYMPLFEKWDDGEEVKWQKYEEGEIRPEFGYIEESLFDGTFDKLHDDGLLKYHQAGKPKKLAIKWHIKKSEYTAYFWFEDEKTCSIFERFYGAHPDTKTDFIIRIDAEQKKYELALYRQGLKEPQIISEDAYQLLVFKNKFEHYRSDNYNQERGAWIW